MNILRAVTVLVFGFALSGCEILKSVPKHDPAFAPVEAADLRTPYQNTGSIYQAGYDMRLFEDHKAQRVGDVLTVRLVERMDASKDADMDISRDHTTEVKVPIILGQEGAEILGYDMQTSLKSANAFQGKGESNQSNTLRGDISVTVVEVLPNGNLKVRGEKRVTLNQGHEYIRLSGIVRPVDIDVSNTVLSTRVADATMMYTGDGAMADASRMGWLGRFFTSILFPF
ncbi:MAG: flagellar basal body L-ring protein FlgH [Pseudomonadota bacterium]